jgi:hypothetical protein
MPLGPIPITDQILKESADRLELLLQLNDLKRNKLEELQQFNDSMQTDRDLWIKVGREKIEAAEKRIDELLKELHEARVEAVQLKQAQLERTRPEPSRLEIAAIFMAENNPAAYVDECANMCLKMADALIAAAKEGGK